jgi:hypothetical protein
MSFVQAAIHQQLQATAAVTAICSTRGYPGVLPQGATLPAYVYMLVSDVGVHHMTNAAGLALARVQVDCYSATESGAHTLAEAVRDALQGQRFTQASTTIRTCHLDNGNTFYESPIDGSDAGRYIRTLDFLVNYTQST